MLAVVFFCFLLLPLLALRWGGLGSIFRIFAQFLRYFDASEVILRFCVDFWRFVFDFWVLGEGFGKDFGRFFR